MSQKTYRTSKPEPTAQLRRAGLKPSRFLCLFLFLVLVVSACSSNAPDTTNVAIDLSETEQSLSDLAGDDSSATGITVDGTRGSASLSDSALTDDAVPFPTGDDTSALQPPESSSPANRQAAQAANSSSQVVSSTSNSSVESRTPVTVTPDNGDNPVLTLNPVGPTGQASQASEANSTGSVAQAPTFATNSNSTGATNSGSGVAVDATDQPNEQTGIDDAEMDMDMMSLEPSAPGISTSTRSPAASQDSQDSESILNSDQVAAASAGSEELSPDQLAEQKETEEIRRNTEIQVGADLVTDDDSDGSGVTERRVAADVDCENRPWSFGCDGPAPDPADLASFQNADTADTTNSTGATDATDANSDPLDEGAAVNAGDSDTPSASSGQQPGVVVPQEVIDALLAPVPTSDTPNTRDKSGDVEADVFDITDAVSASDPEAGAINETSETSDG